MKYTANYNMEKQEGHDYIDIEAMNRTIDVVDRGLTLYLGVTDGQGGSYTITSENITSLREGLAVCVRFHAASSVTSTLNINGLGAKTIRKNGGADVTNLKAGMYTLRYDGTNFILQGEGAGGNATASDLLLNKTATTDAGDITGTMPNNGAVNQFLPINGTYNIPAGYHNGSGKVTQSIASKSAATYTPGTSDQTIASGQYLSGAQTIKGDADLVPANIKAGVDIFGQVGTYAGEVTELYNFPLSIQDTQPTAVRNGHIWVKSNQPLSAITTVKIVEAVNAGEANGTLMLVVNSTELRNVSTSHTKKTTDGASKSFSTSDNNTSNTWLVQYLTGSITSSMYLNAPMVYSKIGGVLDVETAYMWNGSSWVLLSQKGSYAMLASWSFNEIYNMAGDSFVLHSNSQVGIAERVSRDGTFMLTNTSNKTVWVRNGNVFSSLFTLPDSKIINGNTATYVGTSATMSGDGRTVAGLYYYYNGANRDVYIVIYNYNGSTFIEKTVGYMHSATTQYGDVAATGQQCLYLNIDGTLAVMKAVDNGNYTIVGAFIKGTSIVRTIVKQSFSSFGGIGFNVDGSMYLNTVTGSDSYIDRYTVNTSNNTCSLARSIKAVSYTNNNNYLIIHPLGHVFHTVSNNNSDLFYYTPSGESKYVSGILAHYNNISCGFNLEGTRAMLRNNGASSTFGYYSVSASSSGVSFTKIRDIGNTYSGSNNFRSAFLIPW